MDRHSSNYYGLLFLIGVFLGLCGYVITGNVTFRSYVMGDSMNPSLYDGECVMGIRMNRIHTGLKRGDIVSFCSDDDPHIYVKRIVGLPGETVIIKDGSLYIDGSFTALEEPYLIGDWTTDTGPYYFEVPDSCYLVLGDNRDNPYVDDASILAKLYFVYRPVYRFRYLY